MKTKKLFSMFTTGILVTTLLVACSSKQSNINSKQVQSVEDVKTIAFMQLANEKKEHIWYDLSDSNGDSEISKDDSIYTIYITRDGKVDTYFIQGELTLSDIKDKSNDEIKKLAKQQDEATFDQKSKDFATPKLNYTQLYPQYRNKPVNATVKTDSTGNTAVEERIEFPTYSIDPDSGDVEVGSHDPNFTTTISGQIYDTHYVGYVDPEEFTGNDSFLVTAVSSDSVLIVFDTLDTKNVTEE
ncbi:hypothetical protein [Streptococcus sp. S784/96/1]|uniref:hypothetical protein n=1 Tax=Streptococcus sp. S784/96/1 TaxID=2653499 RepID=UPI00138A3B33|nr:hypothetical protein [Streptococcus sp. S784/96/1]